MELRSSESLRIHCSVLSVAVLSAELSALCSVTSVLSALCELEVLSAQCCLFSVLQCTECSELSGALRLCCGAESGLSAQSSELCAVGRVPRAQCSVLTRSVHCSSAQCLHEVPLSVHCQCQCRGSVWQVSASMLSALLCSVLKTAEELRG